MNDINEQTILFNDPSFINKENKWFNISENKLSQIFTERQKKTNEIDC